MESILNLLWALGLMAIAIALSTWQRLGLEWQLTLATGRMVLQLVVLGYVLAAVFAINSSSLVIVAVVGLLVLATVTTSNRISQSLPAVRWWVGGSLGVGLLVVMAYTTLLVVRPSTWYSPQYVIPLAAIVLGYGMNAAAVTGERFVSTLKASRWEIETHLSLGATPQQAIAPYRQAAIQAGMMPILNAMMLAGLVTIPQIMAGQLLSGIDPLTAMAYQLVIFVMVACATLITLCCVTWGIGRQYFNSAAQLIR